MSYHIKKDGTPVYVELRMEIVLMEIYQNIFLPKKKLKYMQTN